MAVITSSKTIFSILGCLCLAALVASRPQNTIDSQVTSSNKGLNNEMMKFFKDSLDQDSSNEIRRLYNAYNNYPGSNAISPEERMALNRLQYEMMANYVQNR